MKKIYLIITILLLSSITTFSQMAIVVNKSNSVSKIDVSQLKDFYKLDKLQWENGNQVMLLTYKKNELNNSFYDILGFNSMKLNKLWLKKKLTGEGNPPFACSSYDAMIKKVEENENAIGYLPKDKVTPNMKIIMEF